jgi:predicted ATPase
VVLRIPGEHEWRLAGLALPEGDEPELLLAAPAVALFVERVRAVRPDFAADEAAAEALADICRRLEGLPLAVELAARRLGVMSLAELRGRLESRLALLTGGRRDALAHQRTLRDTIRWSYDLLPAHQQLSFRWLAVFQGGFGLTLAEDLLSKTTEIEDALEVLGDLVDSSLLIRTELADGTSRFGMLEAIREFGVERLSEESEQQAISGHHAELMSVIAARAAEGLTGAEQSSYLELLDLESANLRAALQYCRTAQSVALVPLATSLWRYWEIRGQLTEGRHWLESALAIADGDLGSGLPEAVHAEACLAAAALARDQGDGPAADLHCERALVIAEAEGNQRISARAFNIQGNVALDEGRLADAATAHTRGMELFAAVGDERGMALLRNNLGLDLAALGRPQEALVHLQDSLQRFEKLDDLRGVARVLISLAAVTAADHPDEARELYARALLSHRSIGDLNGIAAGLEGLGLIAVRTGQARHAVRLLGAAHRVRIETGDAPAAEDHKAVESALADARIELGEQQFEEEWAVGAALPLTTVIGEALQGG